MYRHVDHDLYFEYLKAREFQSSLLQMVQLLGSGPRVCENVQMEPIVGQSIQC